MPRTRGKNKKGSIKYQLKQRLKSLQRFGQSRHEAKKATPKDASKSPIWSEGIYSYRTYQKYREESYRFIDWVRDNYNLKDINQVKPHHVKEYMEIEKARNLSASTLQGKMAAFRKVFGYDRESIGLELPRKNKLEITQNRGEKEHHKKVSYEKHKDKIEFIKGTGLRRNEALALKPENVAHDGSHVLIPPGGEGRAKGGKPRMVTVRQEYREYVKQMAEKAREQGKNRVIEHIPEKLNVHKYRQDYVWGRYREEAKSINEIKGEKVKDSRGRMSDRIYWERGRGRGKNMAFDRLALQKVSQDIGHNREEVIVTHYR